MPSHSTSFEASRKRLFSGTPPKPERHWAPNTRPRKIFGVPWPQRLKVRVGSAVWCFRIYRGKRRSFSFNSYNEVTATTATATANKNNNNNKYKQQSNRQQQQQRQQPRPQSQPQQQPTTTTTTTATIATMMTKTPTIIVINVTLVMIMILVKQSGMISRMRSSRDEDEGEYRIIVMRIGMRGRRARMIETTV